MTDQVSPTFPDFDNDVPHSPYKPILGLGEFIPPTPEDVTVNYKAPVIDDISNISIMIPAAGTAKYDDTLYNLISKFIAALILIIEGVETGLLLFATLPVAGVTGVPDPSEMLKNDEPPDEDDPFAGGGKKPPEEK